MGKSNKSDKQVQDLIKIVEAKKAEIQKAERPNYITNMSFGFTDNSADRTNLQVAINPVTFSSIVGFLSTKKTEHELGETILSLPFTEFKWLGFTYNEWISDIQTRVNKIQINKKKSELELLEKRLNSLISPELRAKLELDEISKLLS